MYNLEIQCTRGKGKSPIGSKDLTPTLRQSLDIISIDHDVPLKRHCAILEQQNCSADGIDLEKLYIRTRHLAGSGSFSSVKKNFSLEGQVQR
jgi:hypothetical protein